MANLLDTEVKFLKGVGEKRALVLEKELGIKYYKDLLYYFPYRYVDKSQFLKINEINSDEVYIQVKGRINDKQVVGGEKNLRLVVGFTDETGRIELVFFKGIAWISNNLKVGEEYVIFGKPSRFQNTFNFVHPEIEVEHLYNQSPEKEKYMPLYNTTEKMKNSYLNSKAMAKLTQNLVFELNGVISETLPKYILDKYHLPSLNDSLFEIHYPLSAEKLSKARLRLKFEELFFLQLLHLIQKTIRIEKSDGFVFSCVGKHFNDFYKNNLPFTLTDAQKRVVKEIRNDMRSGRQMNRLLQGDVGSGKTLVALLCMLIAIDNGFQATILAPTEILAQQHYQSIRNFLSGLDINVALLIGSVKQKERKTLLPDLKEGKINILIGTHAILEDNVVFSNLGLAVIDEQHRFGVEQRSKMWNKNTERPPHILVMTATPIPRTLAMTVYGDLDYSVIDELPPGRKPIKTIHCYDKDILRLYAFMHRQIKEGRQIYVVYPLIKESQKLDLKDLMDGYDSLVREFPLPEYQISIVNGQQKPEVKEYEMQRFIKGQTNIMVATTVIEVGVDVKNACVMIIENSERFGLSQLHQLRGRVGRSDTQSYCVLKTKDDLSSESRKRIKTMCETNNGFEIAQADLQLRGPGDIAGTQQSGVLDLKIADIVKDEPLVKEARQMALFILNNDKTLSLPENKLLRDYIIKKHPITDFSKIS